MNPDLLAKLADRAAGHVAALAEDWQAGNMTDAEFDAITMAVVSAAQAQGVTLADLSIATVLGVGALGMLADGHETGRAAVVLATIKAQRAAADLAEIARVETSAEVLDTAQRASGRSMSEHGVKTWTRRLNAGACPYCTDLAGAELPVSVNILRHKGCGCTQRPSNI